MPWNFPIQVLIGYSSSRLARSMIKSEIGPGEHFQSALYYRDDIPWAEIAALDSNSAFRGI
jgi:hypothetical protein